MFDKVFFIEAKSYSSALLPYVFISALLIFTSLICVVPPTGPSGCFPLPFTFLAHLHIAELHMVLMLGC